MGSSKAANAVLAKAKAKYGKRLTEKDYSNLLLCNSVSEVVTYLKNNTYYDTVLKKVNEREIHRGRLEMLLKQKLCDDFYSLCLYTKGSGEHFSQYILEKNEIEQIIHFLTLLSSGGLEEKTLDMPSYFLSHTSINVDALSAAKTYGQFYASLSGSPYEKLLSGIEPATDGRINIAKIENVLYKFCYDNLYNSIQKYASGQERKALLQMFNSIMDYMNFVRVFRLKRYYKISQEETKEYLFPYGTMNKKTIDKLCRAASSAEVFDAVADTSFGKQLKKLNYVFAGQIDDVGIYKVTKDNMYFSAYPLVVMLSYVFVMETEYQNVVSIIEGVRYNVDSNKIKTIVIT